MQSSSVSARSTTGRGARKPSRSQADRLGAYLAAGLGAATGITATSDAAIIQIDVGPSGFNIGGVNGGVAAGTFQQVADFPTAGEGALGIANGFSNINASYQGIFGIPGEGLKFASALQQAAPTNFAKDAPIDGTAGWFEFPTTTLFRLVATSTYTSPDFGPDSYMGFQTASGNYGWLEVTWTAATNEFQILSGAYESVPNTPILAGQLAPVPEPSTLAMGGVGALVCGGAALRRWRKQRRA